MENTENKELNTITEETEAQVEQAVEEAAQATEEAAQTAEETAQAAAERELKASTIAKREKKRAAREEKAARKEANKVEEKKSRPNNILLAVLIIGIVVGMFAFIAGYNYFTKPASIEKYLEKNGGEDVYGQLAIDEFTTAAITADGNSMHIKMEVTADDESLAKILTDAYKGEDGQKQLKYYGSYFLTTMKPAVRGFSADADVTVSINGEEISSTTVTYKEAKDIIENGFGDDEDEDEADDDADEAEDDADDAGETEEDSGTDN